MKNNAVFCIAKDRSRAESIVEALKAAGFPSTDISVLLPDTSGTRDFAHEQNTKLPEGATTGVVAGMGTGAILGWLAGIGTLAIPGVGPFIAAGPIMAALGGAAVGGKHRHGGPGNGEFWPVRPSACQSARWMAE